MQAKGTLDSMPQKEASRLRHELARLERNLTGIAGMKNMPGALVVVDVNREAIAVREANRVGIPVAAMVDTNTDPDPINYPIPANDDSTRAIKLIINVLADIIIKAAAERAQTRTGDQDKPTAPQSSTAEKKPAVKPTHEKRTRRNAAPRHTPGEKKAADDGKSTQPPTNPQNPASAPQENAQHPTPDKV